MAILTLSRFRAKTVMPTADVDLLEATEPGYIESRGAYHEGRLNARLAKRYAVPFDSSSPPEVVLGWLVDMVTLDAYKKRGFNPSSAQDQTIVDDAARATAEVLEAANSETGMFELPLRQSAPGADGVSKGGPFGYAEASPYTWARLQREAVRGER